MSISDPTAGSCYATNIDKYDYTTDTYKTVQITLKQEEKHRILYFEAGSFTERQ